MLVSVLTSQNVVVEYEPASLGDRIVAALIDYLVIFAWGLILLLITARLSGDISGNVLLYLLLILPVLFYDLLFEWLFNGQSPGKMAMSIRVVMQDGSRPGLGACLMRWLLRMIESVWFFGGIVPVLTIGINGRGQRVGDLAAGTTVIKIKPDLDLNELLVSAQPADYVVQYPEARQLSDRDAGILRQALARPNEQVLARAVEKIQAVTGIVPKPAPAYQAIWLRNQEFLATLLRDHQFLTGN